APAFRGPNTQMNSTTTWIVSGTNACGKQTRTQCTDGDSAQRGGKNDQENDDDGPRGARGKINAQLRCNIGAEKQPRQPASCGQGHGGQLPQRLQQASASSHGFDVAWLYLLGFGGCGINNFRQ